MDEEEEEEGIELRLAWLGLMDGWRDGWMDGWLLASQVAPGDG